LFLRASWSRSFGGILGFIARRWSTTKYLPPNVYRGFEGPGFPATADIVRDTLQLSADFRTVTFEFRTGEMLDEARIITRARTNSGVVPEPSTACFAAISLLSVGLWRRP
jgi:hypothetical protein